MSHLTQQDQEGFILLYPILDDIHHVSICLCLFHTSLSLPLVSLLSNLNSDSLVCPFSYMISHSLKSQPLWVDLKVCALLPVSKNTQKTVKTETSAIREVKHWCCTYCMCICYTLIIK